MKHSDFKAISAQPESVPQRHVSEGADTIQSQTSQYGSIISTIGSLERLVQQMFRSAFSPLPMRDMFGQYGVPGQIGFHPLVDLYEHGNELIIRCELPGMDKDTIKVNIGEDNTLVISGARVCDDKFEKGDYVRQECSYGSFKRSLTLPEGCESQNATASYKNGILEIHVPKSEESRKGFSVKVQ